MPESMKERYNRIINDAETMNTICGDTANGGSLIKLAETWNIRYSDILFWIYADAERKRQYLEAVDARNEWTIHRLLDELRSLSFINARLLFDENHALLTPDKWPDDICRAISSIEVDEIWDETAGFEVGGKKKKVQIGETKKLKLYDKLKAIELLGKDLGRFISKHEVTGKLTLEDLVTGSLKKD